jgi:hypothetical protein
MWKSIVIFFFIVNSTIFAKSNLEVSVATLLKKDIVTSDLIFLSSKAKKSLSKKQSDDSYYFAYDLIKTLDVALALEDYSPENCTMAKNKLFVMYGIKSIEKSKTDMPRGASAGMAIINKACSQHKKK